jgi:hypothetical protein
VLPKNLNPEQLSGSHYDLGATLIELAANSGHRYHAIGRNILQPRDNDITLSRLWVMDKDIIASATGDHIIEDLAGNPMSCAPEKIDPMIRKYNLTQGISWWRLVKGNDLPKK